MVTNRCAGWYTNAAAHDRNPIVELSVDDVAQAIHVPVQEIRDIIEEHGNVMPSIALRLAKLFGMSADFRMNVQLRWELYYVQQSEHTDLDSIQPLVRAA